MKRDTTKREARIYYIHIFSLILPGLLFQFVSFHFLQRFARFLVGDIVYGGHIEEDCDLKIIQSYLKICLNKEILTGGAIAPMLTVPEGSITKETMMRHIEDNLNSKSPSMMGLHPNTEIGFRMRMGRSVCQDLLVLKCGFEPKGGNGARVMSTDECAKEVSEFSIQNARDTRERPY